MEGNTVQETCRPHKWSVVTASLSERRFNIANPAFSSEMNMSMEV